TNGKPTFQSHTMSNPGEHPPLPVDESAGVTVYVEAPEKVTLPPPRQTQPPAERALPPLTPEELAGVFVYLEGPEKVYVQASPPPGAAAAGPTPPTGPQGFRHYPQEAPAPAPGDGASGRAQREPRLD